MLYVHFWTSNFLSSSSSSSSKFVCFTYTLRIAHSAGRMNVRNATKKITIVLTNAFAMVGYYVFISLLNDNEPKNSVL